MLEIKEEKQNKQRFYVNRTLPTESFNLTSRKFNTYNKRQEFRHLKQSKAAQRKTANLFKKNNQMMLPLLEDKPIIDPANRIQQSVIFGNLNNQQLVLKKIKISQLSGKTKRSTQSISKKSCNETIGHLALNSTCYIPKRSKKCGYEGKKMRQKKFKKELSNIYTYYGRIQSLINLQPLRQKLKKQVIKQNINTFSLLKENIEKL